MSLDDLKQKLTAGIAEVSEHYKEGMRQIAELCRAECRRANAAEAKLEKATAAHEKTKAALAETKRQVAEIDARYSPLVSENDELRERLRQFEGDIGEMT